MRISLICIRFGVFFAFVETNNKIELDRVELDNFSFRVRWIIVQKIDFHDFERNVPTKKLRNQLIILVMTKQGEMHKSEKEI